ncbi:MAG: DUF211 domain-containing protein [Candidatus Odinarchaeum yellowstonii]|jgi:hypothetical protein|uniref:DUF211 domain-containing protein n=1 Tax=Odinarchaeota yellowstonii (strain LCB_4) TaxID=1841599 RepID=A0AAF0IAX2_ODILC|nr:MAG: DUF211 domain-containing protein [Candidatus Odinarchaeum yellowstonii]
MAECDKIEQVEGVTKGIRRIVLDVLKPHTPNLVELAGIISRIEGVCGVNISLVEVDADTESVKVTIMGSNLNYSIIKAILEKYGAAVHSIDQVVAGRMVVEEPSTHQL